MSKNTSPRLGTELLPTTVYVVSYSYYWYYYFLNKENKDFIIIIIASVVKITTKLVKLYDSI